jgi:hypothetical protein
MMGLAFLVLSQQYPFLNHHLKSHPLLSYQLFYPMFILVNQLTRINSCLKPRPLLNYPMCN